MVPGGADGTVRMNQDLEDPGKEGRGGPTVSRETASRRAFGLKGILQKGGEQG